MAESALSFVAGRLGQFLTEEAALLGGVHDEVEWMRDQLEWMKSFLQDAHAKRRSGDQRAKRWERAVRDATYHVEDIIESYKFQIIRRRQQLVRCCWILKPVETWTLELKPRHKLGVEMKKLKAKINQINENRINYGLVDLGQSAPDSAANTALQKQRRTSPQHSDNVIVGFHDHKHNILQELLNTRITRRCVKSIVGMGGLGKTTLAQMVFNSNEIKSSFDTHAWVSVSQDYTLVDLFTIIGKQVAGAQSQGLDESALKESIYQSLLGKRYLITMDDIWRVEDWRILECVFPDSGNGSRVLVTTRFETVAKFADPRTNPYYLPLLDEKESWQLFLATALPSDVGTEQKSCPKGLEDVAQVLVERCSGLPLALVVLGGLMSTKRPTVMAWKKVAQQMDWASIQDGEHCLKILALSYNDLSDHQLRSCFQYLAVFPEDMIIKASQVIELWIAEGFITQQGNHTMEDKAEIYLDQLALRSMIQVVKRYFDGSVKSFRLHDLFRELCLGEAREDGLLDVHSTSSDLDQIADKNPIRLALQNIYNMEDIHLPPVLRSLSTFGESKVKHEGTVSLKKLRVLNLNHHTRISPMKKFWTPNLNHGLFPLEFSLEGMFYLRYLRLVHCFIRSEFPSSRDLCNLQILDVSNCVPQLSEELGKIHTLRHIYASGVCLLPSNIGHLKSLQTLDKFSARGGWIEQSLGMLSNIRKLCIIGLETTQEEVFVNALGKLQHLSCLKLSDGSISAEFIRALSFNNCLFVLKLYGKLRQRKLPDTLEFPQNLTVLKLHGTELEEDPMTTLEQLPNLASLTLEKDAYVGNEMVCNTGGFPRLERLVFSRSYTLISWSVAEGAMPKISYLCIEDCLSLNELPMGLENLTSLKELKVIDARREFRSRLEEGHGKDWWRIKHVPSITVI